MRRLVRRIIEPLAVRTQKSEGHKMNSYIRLILEAEGANKRLQRLFQSVPEPEKNNQWPPLTVVRKQRQRWRRSVRSKTLSPTKALGYCASKVSLAAQCDIVGIKVSIWIAGYVVAVLGLVNAAYSEQPLLWLAIWPAPIVLASTSFIFFRQGFHFRDGVLIFGRRHD